MSTGTRKCKQGMLSAPSSRAPPRFAAWVAMVVGLVSAGKGHPARWLMAAHAADEKTLELVARLNYHEGMTKEIDTISSRL